MKFGVSLRYRVRLVVFSPQHQTAMYETHNVQLKKLLEVDGRARDQLNGCYRPGSGIWLVVGWLPC
jgi:hypothetical protein